MWESIHLPVLIARKTRSHLLKYSIFSCLLTFEENMDLFSIAPKGSIRTYGWKLYKKAIQMLNKDLLDSVCYLAEEQCAFWSHVCIIVLQTKLAISGMVCKFLSWTGGWARRSSKSLSSL